MSQEKAPMPIQTSPGSIGPSATAPLQGDLGLLGGMPTRGPPIGPTDPDMAQFINDIRGIVPPMLKDSSWAYSSNLLGMSLLTPRLAEAIRCRFKAHAQLLKMKVPKRRITPEYSIWLDNLLLLGTIQTSRATRPEPERKILSTQSSEILTRPATQRKKFLGLL